MSVIRSLIAAAMLGLAATSAPAAVVTFDGVTAPNATTTSPYDSGGLTFSGPDGMYVWDGSSPNSNGTNNLILTAFGDPKKVTITRTGGGLFDLLSFDLATSWYSDVSPNSVQVNGVALAITSTLTTYTLNLLGVTSVTISGLADESGLNFLGIPGNDGYWTADNFVYRTAADMPPVPVPAALPLLLLALGGLGLAARRRRT